MVTYFSRRAFLNAIATAMTVKILPLRTPKPKYQIGERVEYRYFSDDELSPDFGELITETGTVTGIWLDSPREQQPGYSYFVEWDGDEFPDTESYPESLLSTPHALGGVA